MSSFHGAFFDWFSRMLINLYDSVSGVTWFHFLMLASSKVSLTIMGSAARGDPLCPTLVLAHSTAPSNFHHAILKSRICFIFKPCSGADYPIFLGEKFLFFWWFPFLLVKLHCSDPSKLPLTYWRKSETPDTFTPFLTLFLVCQTFSISVATNAINASIGQVAGIKNEWQPSPYC